MFVNSQRWWLVNELKGHINRRFQVKLSFANSEDNQSMLTKTMTTDAQNQWIDMSGDPSNITNVKVSILLYNYYYHYYCHYYCHNHCHYYYHYYCQYHSRYYCLYY